MRILNTIRALLTIGHPSLHAAGTLARFVIGNVTHAQTLAFFDR